VSPFFDYDRGKYYIRIGFLLIAFGILAPVEFDFPRSGGDWIKNLGLIAWALGFYKMWK
jgi:hypothetical protein